MMILMIRIAGIWRFSSHTNPRGGDRGSLPVFCFFAALGASRMRKEINASNGPSFFTKQKPPYFGWFKCGVRTIAFLPSSRPLLSSFVSRCRRNTFKMGQKHSAGVDAFFHSTSHMSPKRWLSQVFLSPVRRGGKKQVKDGKKNNKKTLFQLQFSHYDWNRKVGGVGARARARCSRCSFLRAPATTLFSPIIISFVVSLKEGEKK